MRWKVSEEEKKKGEKIGKVGKGRQGEERRGGEAHIYKEMFT